jgi:hypothetical protein
LRLHWNKCIKGDLHMVKLGAVSTQCELWGQLCLCSWPCSRSWNNADPKLDVQKSHVDQMNANEISSLCTSEDGPGYFTVIKKYEWEWLNRLKVYSWLYTVHCRPRKLFGKLPSAWPQGSGL